MTRTITLSDGRKLQYDGDDAYDRAEDWHSNTPANEIYSFCVGRGVDLFDKQNNRMVEDWADLAMHCWAKSKGLAA